MTTVTTRISKLSRIALAIGTTTALVACGSSSTTGIAGAPGSAVTSSSGTASGAVAAYVAATNTQEYNATSNKSVAKSLNRQDGATVLGTGLLTNGLNGTQTAAYKIGNLQLDEIPSGTVSPGSSFGGKITIDGVNYDLKLARRDNETGNFSFRRYYTIDGTRTDSTLNNREVQVVGYKTSSGDSYVVSIQHIAGTNVFNTAGASNPTRPFTLFDNYIAGAITPTASMPTGSATYSGEWDSSVLNNTGQPTGSAGTAAINIDFSNNTVSGGLTKTGGGSAFTSLAGTVSGNTLTGTMSSVANGYTGTIAGGFFGPAADQIGVVGVGTRQQSGSTQNVIVNVLGNKQ